MNNERISIISSDGLITGFGSNNVITINVNQAMLDMKYISKQNIYYDLNTITLLGMDVNNNVSKVDILQLKTDIKQDILSELRTKLDYMNMSNGEELNNIKDAILSLLISTKLKK